MSAIRDDARKDALLRTLEGSRPGDLLLLAGGDMKTLGRTAQNYRLAHGHPGLVIYAPDRNDSIQAHGSAGLDNSIISTNPEALAEMLARHLVYEPASRICLFPPLEIVEFKHIPQLRQARAAMDRALSRSRVNSDTRATHWQNWLDNLVQNFPAAFCLPDLTTLAGVFQGIPALVLGAGPSLDQSLDALQKASSKCLILGAASVLSPLSAVGVKPHLAAALEGKDESRQFQNADASATLLAAASSGHYNHFRNWPGKPSVFHMQAWVRRLTGQGLALPTGGHATSVAFSLAVLWGCDPIILAGQDLAYPGGRVHAAGRPGGEDYRLPDLTKVQAIGGGTVETSAVMESYLNWYGESASYLKRAAPARRLINATAQGALIPGFIHRNLTGVIDQMPVLPEAVNLVSISAGLPGANDSILKKRLSQEISLTRRTLLALQSGGLEKAFAASGKDSAAGWSLDSMPRGASTESLASKLNYLLEALGRMREALHESA